jgi:hypothetical protein
MAYRLKPNCESFTVTDGEFAGKTYDPATEYETIPPEEKEKFEEIGKTKLEAAPAPQVKRSKKMETSHED